MTIWRDTGEAVSEGLQVQAWNDYARIAFRFYGPFRWQFRSRDLPGAPSTSALPANWEPA